MFKKPKSHGYVLGVIFLFCEFLSVFIVINGLKNCGNIGLISDWMFIFSITPIAQLSVSGYVNIISREVAKSSAAINNFIDFSIILEARKLLKKSAWFIFLIILAVSIYILHSKNQDLFFAWLIFAIGISARMVLQWTFAFYLGLQLYGLDKIISISCTISAVACSRFGMANYPDIKLVAGLYSLPYVIGAIYSLIKVNKMVCPDAISEAKKNEPKLRRTEIIKMYLLGVCGFLNLNADQFVARINLPVEQYVDYAIMSKIIAATISLCATYTNLQLPAYAILAKSGDWHNLVSFIFRNSLLVLTANLIVGVVSVSSFGVVVETFTGQTKAISNSVLIMLNMFSAFSNIVINIGMAIVSIGESDLSKSVFPVSIFGLVLSTICAKYFQVEGLVAAMVFSIFLSLVMHVKVFLAQKSKIISK